jgi:hypothetical protein
MGPFSMEAIISCTEAQASELCQFGGHLDQHQRARRYPTCKIISISYLKDFYSMQILLDFSNIAPVTMFNYVTLFFWLVAIGGPFLVYKCIMQAVLSDADSNKWAQGMGEHYTAQVTY